MGDELLGDSSERRAQIGRGVEPEVTAAEG